MTNRTDRVSTLDHLSDGRAFLGIGAKESLRFSEHERAFQDFVRDEKIYQRRMA